MVSFEVSLIKLYLLTTTMDSRGRHGMHDSKEFTEVINGTQKANFDFVVEDYRGFDISRGLTENPTIGVLGKGSNK